MKIRKRITLPSLLAILLMAPAILFAQTYEVHVRRGIADKNVYSKPASLMISYPDSADSFYSINVGITGKLIQPGSHFLFKEQSLTFEMHKNTELDKEQDLFSLTASTYGIKNFSGGILNGLALNNNAEFSYKVDNIKDNNTIKLEYNLTPVWSQAGISRVFFIENAKDAALLGFYLEPKAGINYESTVKNESSLDGSIARTRITLTAGIYPFYDWLDKRLIATANRTWWQTLNDENFLTLGESKSPKLWDISLAFYFTKDQSAGIQAHYINGSNPAQNLDEQKYWKVSFVFKK